MADIERWITVNGAHIPIIKGESRARAVSNFIKSKQKARKSEIRNKLKGALRDPNSPKGKELLKNAANFVTRDENPTIKGRAKTKEEIDESRYVEYKNIEEKAKKELERAAGGKRANQTYLAARHADEKMTEKYKTRYWGDTPNKSYKLKADKETPAKRTIKGFKTREELDRRYNEAYNKGEDLRDSYSERLQPLKDMPNKWDKESDRIHRQYKQAFMSKYKLKVDKRTIRGAITDKERRANKAALPYREKRQKYEAQGDKYYEKAQNEPRNTTGSDNRFHSAMSKMSIAYEKAHKADERAGETWLKTYYGKKKYTYKRKK